MRKTKYDNNYTEHNHSDYGEHEHVKVKWGFQYNEYAITE